MISANPNLNAGYSLLGKKIVKRKKEIRKINDWFEQIPRRFFSYPMWNYSAYVGLGYIIVGFLHYRIWIQSGQVETIFSVLQLDIVRPSPEVALLIYIILAIGITILVHGLLRRLNQIGAGAELVFWGITVSAVAAWFPWLFASSVTNTVFLFLFGVAAFSGYAIARHILRDVQDQAGSPVFDPWKTLVHATKACTALIAVLLGAIATIVILPWRGSDVEGPELFRYTLLSAYFIAGLLGFILMPLFVKALEIGPFKPTEIEPPSIL